MEPTRTQTRTKARKNAGDQIIIGFSSASDWLGEWRESLGSVTEQSKAKPRENRVIFDTRFKMVLFVSCVLTQDLDFGRVLK